MSAYGLIKPLENESGDRVAFPVPFKMRKAERVRSALKEI